MVNELTPSAIALYYLFFINAHYLEF